MDSYLCSLIDQLEQEHTLTPCTDPVLRAYGLHPWTD